MIRRWLYTALRALTLTAGVDTTLGTPWIAMERVELGAPQGFGFSGGVRGNQERVRETGGVAGARE